MKRTLRNQFLTTGLLIVSTTLSAQVTKLSQGDNLGGIILNGRPVMVNLKDYTFYTTDGTANGTTAFTNKVILDPGGIGKGFVANNKLYFSGTDETHGTELWVTDGTDAGTVMIKDINPGNGNASPRNFCLLNNELYFFADDGTHGIELWKTNGTTAGTTLVKDINPGKDSSLNKDYFTLMDTSNNSIYFFADDGTHGAELWKSDGTTAGTLLVKDINANGSAFVFDWNRNYNYSFKTLGNITLFTANDGVHGYELWKTDGTNGGTQLVKDVNAYPNSSSWPRDFLLFNGKMYFVPGTNACDFWETDGTIEGTKPLKAEWEDFPYRTQLDHVAIVNGKIIFSAVSNVYGDNLWVSDGTSDGTHVLKAINSASNFGPLIINMSSPGYLTKRTYSSVCKGKAYLWYWVSNYQMQLWVTDGTEQGTSLLKTLSTVENYLPYSDTIQAYFAENAMYLTSRRPSAKDSIDIWKTDGTTNGTIPVATVRARADNKIPLSFQFLYNNQLYFNCFDSSAGYVNARNLYKLNETVRALPVSLLNLTAELQQKSVRLDWATAMEINSSHFEILRSTDGLKYSRIGTVGAAGNSTLMRKYNYNDASALNTGADILYYKLQMFDKDGSYKYSNVALVHLNEVSIQVKIFPNPVSNILTVRIQSASVGNANLSVFNTNGRIVYSKTTNSTSTSYTENINVADLPAGMYFLRMQSGKNSSTTSFLKQ